MYYLTGLIALLVSLFWSAAGLQGPGWIALLPSWLAFSAIALGLLVSIWRPRGGYWLSGSGAILTIALIVAYSIELLSVIPLRRYPSAWWYLYLPSLMVLPLLLHGLAAAIKLRIRRKTEARSPARN